MKATKLAYVLFIACSILNVNVYATDCNSYNPNAGKYCYEQNGPGSRCCPNGNCSNGKEGDCG